LVAGWYGQGLRLLDISDARNMRQVGFYRVVGTGAGNLSSNSWDVAWYNDEPPKGKGSRRGRKATHSRRGDYIYLMDMNRGVEVVRLKGGAGASARMTSVVAPSVRKDSLWAAKPVAGSSAAAGGYVCPLVQ
jgi:hypothetical protein